MYTTVGATSQPEPVKTHDVYTGPPITEEYVKSINRKWRGVGIGYHNGLWGRSYAQGLKLDIPFGRKVGQFFGIRLQATFVHPTNIDGQYDPVVNSGLEFFGRGPVWLGLFRVYGGGGAWVGSRPNPTSEGKVYQFTGGGHIGTEFLVSPRMSFTFEIGGQGPGHGLRNDDAGANVMGGFMIYLGDIGRR